MKMFELWYVDRLTLVRRAGIHWKKHRMLFFSYLPRLGTLRIKLKNLKPWYVIYCVCKPSIIVFVFSLIMIMVIKKLF